MSETVFIVGPPRSGTSLLYKALCLHPDVSYLSNWVEHFPSLPALSVLNRVPPSLPKLRRAVWFEGGSNAYVYGRRRSILRRAFPAPVEGERVFRQCGIGATPGGHLPGRTPDLDRLRRLFGIVRATGGGRVMVSKRIAHNLRIPLLATAFEDARFVVLLRDGRAVAHSLARVNWWQDSYLWWRQTTPRKWVENGGDAWDLCAGEWVEELKALEDGLLQIESDRYMWLKYEDLVADPLPTLRRVADFSRLSADPAWEREIESLSFPDRNQTWVSALGAEVVSRISEVQQPLLAHYGYA